MDAALASTRVQLGPRRVLHALDLVAVVLVDDEDRQEAANVGTHRLGAAEVESLGVRLLGEDRDLVPRRSIPARAGARRCSSPCPRGGSRARRRSASRHREAGALDHLRDGHELVALLLVPLLEDQVGCGHGMAAIPAHRHVAPVVEEDDVAAPRACFSTLRMIRSVVTFFSQSQSVTDQRIGT